VAAPTAVQNEPKALLQGAMHSHYHRGQDATRLRELGGEPPMTDMMVVVPEETAGAGVAVVKRLALPHAGFLAHAGENNLDELPRGQAVQYRNSLVAQFVGEDDVHQMPRRKRAELAFE
jgi:hypothetical protein